MLRAAAEAFAAADYPEVTLAAIAERAGLTKGAVYFHFKNKDALAQAVVEEFYRRLAAGAERAGALGVPPLCAVVEYLFHVAAMFRDEVLMQAGARLQLERGQIRFPLPAPYVVFSGSIRTWIQQAAAAGDRLPAGFAPDVLTRVLVEAFFGAQHISWIQTGRADLVERTAEIVRVVLGAEAGAVERRLGAG